MGTIHFNNNKLKCIDPEGNVLKEKLIDMLNYIELHLSNLNIEYTYAIDSKSRFFFSPMFLLHSRYLSVPHNQRKRFLHILFLIYLIKSVTGNTLLLHSHLYVTSTQVIL